jgi:hypothetical protein
MMPESESGITLDAGSHRVRSSESSQLEPTIYNTPVAVLRRGTFYVNASVINQFFSDVFVLRWNARAQTITVQRRPGFGQHLKRLR